MLLALYVCCYSVLWTWRPVLSALAYFKTRQIYIHFQCSRCHYVSLFPFFCIWVSISDVIYLPWCRRASGMPPLGIITLALLVIVFLFVLVISIETKCILVFMVVTLHFFLRHTLLGHSQHAGGSIVCSIVLTNMALCCFQFVTYIVSILYFNLSIAFSLLADLSNSPVCCRGRCVVLGFVFWTQHSCYCC